jgi:lipopolysaccharide/colanic/teichoic acid biosynthesis glycosyltransferase
MAGVRALTFEEMVRLDKYYLDNWSVKLDPGIMLKTIYVVLARKGAY